MPVEICVYFKGRFIDLCSGSSKSQLGMVQHAGKWYPKGRFALPNTVHSPGNIGEVRETEGENPRFLTQVISVV